ncbi:WG repeat-containing protein [Natranaerobius thermophilus]|uniref:Substrate-binding region of ABC-type glycine betaine transport system n=1 Tax=Natranaerobius thermophilus (strain ATCC BAA-1301 / DSM 18059 / JW/NM-WN-LF) TaxID=457570 RepID=B2A7C4_NATTJ|nr:WG repeat-containing protein [Natranaerobius thermophilus]ACB84318.1 Substrate-binding region of ABC-type glycine betaine transport system [Natranaerobius thermophilus JW/NM-WN-LF]
MGIKISTVLLVFVLLLLFPGLSSEVLTEISFNGSNEQTKEKSQEQVKVRGFSDYYQLDTATKTENGIRYIPMRTLMSEMDMYITWQDDDQSIFAEREDLELETKIGEQHIRVNNQLITLQNEIRLIDNKSYLPMEFLEQIHTEVSLNEEDQIIDYTPMSAFPVVQNDRYGLIDEEGNKLLDKEFSNIRKQRATGDSDYRANFFMVTDQDENKGIWHPITQDFLIEPQYDRIHPLLEGLFLVREEDKNGLVNLKGETVLDTNYDSLYSFEEGLALVEKDDKYGYVDQSGKEVIDLQFSEVSRFEGGKAPVVKDGNYGVIDKSGEWLIEPEYSKEKYELSHLTDDLLRIAKKVTNDETVREMKYGIMDLSGEIIIEPQFDRIGDFYNGLAFVVDDEDFGYIDKNGEIVIEPQFENAYNFNTDIDGEAISVVIEDGQRGVINQEGEFIIEPVFDRIANVEDADVFIIEQDDEFGVIDKKGNKIIEAKYHRIHDLYSYSYDLDEHYFGVQVDDKIGLYHKSGEQITELIFNDINDPRDGYISVEQNDNWGVFDLEAGDFVIEPKYDSIGEFSQGLASVELDRQWGFIDKGGNVVIEPQFDSVRDFRDGLARIKINSEVGYIDTEGEFVYEPPEPPEPEKTIKIGTTPWLDTKLMSHIFHEALKVKGYDSEVVVSDIGVIFGDIAQDDSQRMDFTFSIYLPHNHEHYYEEYQDDIDKVGEALTGIDQGIAVPEYVSIDSIDDLKGKEEKFNSKIYGIDAGAGISTETEEVLKKYNLDMELITRGDYKIDDDEYEEYDLHDLMLKNLDEKYQAEDPVAITGWKPYYKWAKWDLKMLEDSKEIYTTADASYTFSRKGLEEDLPEIYEAVTNFEMSMEEINSLLLKKEKEDLDFEEIAKKYIDENEEMVESLFE